MLNLKSCLLSVLAALCFSAFSDVRSELSDGASAVSDAWEAGNRSRFERALSRYKSLQERFEAEYHPETTAYVDAMSNFLYYYGTFFFYAWNFGDQDEALDCLQRLSRLWKRSPCAPMRQSMQVIDEFVELAKRGNLPTRFERSDYDGRFNLLYYLTNPGFQAYMAAQNSRARSWQALGAAFDARRQAEERRGECDAYISCLMADLDYQKNTGRKFDPDNRPVKDSVYREPWDRCKRIHDIFSGSSGRQTSRSTVSVSASVGAATDSSAVISQRFATNEGVSSSPPARKAEPEANWYWDGERTTVAEYTAAQLGGRIWRLAKERQLPTDIPDHIAKAVRAGDVRDFCAAALPRFARLEDAVEARRDCWLAMIAAGREPGLTDDRYVRVLADISDVVSSGYQTLAEDAAVAHIEKPRLTQAAKQFRELAVFFGHPASLRVRLTELRKSARDKEYMDWAIASIGAIYMRINDQWIANAKNKAELEVFCAAKNYFGHGKSFHADQKRERDKREMEKVVDEFLSGQVPISVLSDPDSYLRRCTDLLTGQLGFKQDAARARSLFGKVKDRESRGALHFRAMDGEAEAQFKLATILLESGDGSMNRSSAVDWLRAAAKKGHATAVRRLAEIEAQIKAEEEAARRRAEEAARLAAERARQEAERRRIAEEKARIAAEKARIAAEKKRQEAERERRFVESVCKNAVRVQFDWVREREQKVFAGATVVDLPPGEITPDQLPKLSTYVLRLTEGTYSFRNVWLGGHVRIRGAGVGKTIVCGEIHFTDTPTLPGGQRRVVSVSGIDFRPYEEHRPENFDSFWNSFGRFFGIGRDTVPSCRYLAVWEDDILIVRNCRLDGYGLSVSNFTSRECPGQPMLAVENCQFEHPYAKIADSAISAHGARIVVRKSSFRCGSDVQGYGRSVQIDDGLSPRNEIPSTFFAEDCDFHVVNLSVGEDSRAFLKKVAFSERGHIELSDSDGHRRSPSLVVDGLRCPELTVGYDGRREESVLVGDVVNDKVRLFDVKGKGDVSLRVVKVGPYLSDGKSVKCADAASGCPPGWLLPEHFEFARSAKKARSRP